MKLDKLLEFNGRSPEIFEEIKALEHTVKQGSAQAGKSWNSGSGVFNIPHSQDMEWMKTINSKFDEKEIDRISLKFPNSVSLDDLEKLADLQKRNPDKELPKRIKDALGDYGKDVNSFLEKYAEQITIGRDFGWSLVEETGYINFSAIGMSISRIGINSVGTAYSNSIPGTVAYYNQAAFQSASAHAATKMASKVIGPAMMAFDFAFGMQTDIDAGKTNGQAITHNFVSTGVGAGSVAVGSAATAFVLGIAGVSNPIGWVILGGAGIGSVGAIAFEEIYSKNKWNIQKHLDEAGEVLDNLGHAINPMEWEW